MTYVSGIFIALLTSSIASDRPTIFTMDGVNLSEITPTRLTNPCYLKISSTNPETNVVYAQEILDSMIAEIHQDTLVPMDQIKAYFDQTYPNQSACEILSDYIEFSKCVTPEKLDRLFLEKIKSTFNVILDGLSLDQMRNTLKKLDLHASQDTNSETELGLHNYGKNIIRYSIKSPTERFFLINQTGYLGDETEFYTPEAYLKSFTFKHKIDVRIRSDLKDLIVRQKNQTLEQLTQVFSGSPATVDMTMKKEILHLSPPPLHLVSFERSLWDPMIFASKRTSKPTSLSPNFKVNELCGDINRDQECGSVIVEQEQIHKEFHDFMKNKSGITLVDLGSSVGFNSIRYALFDNRVTLCDRSLGSLMIAARFMIEHHSDKLANLSLTTKSAHELCLEENSVDIVFMGFLIKYFPGSKIDQMLKNIYTYLKPNGRIFISEIMPDNIFYQSKEFQIGQQRREKENESVVPFPEKSLNWPDEIGSIYVSKVSSATYKLERSFQFDLTRVSEQDIINGLVRAGFSIESNLTHTSDGSYNFVHMPVIQVIATKTNKP